MLRLPTLAGTAGRWPGRLLRSALAVAALTALALATAPAAGATPAPAGNAGAAHPSSVSGYWPWMNNRPGNQCLGIAGGNMANGTKAVLWPCNDAADQQWSSFDVFDGQSHEFRNSANYNKCLGVAGSSTAGGAQLVIWDCNGSLDQRWWANFDAHGCYELENLNSSLLIGVAGRNTTPGTALVQWKRDNDPNQSWC